LGCCYLRQKLAEGFDRETCILHDSAQREGVDGIVTRNGEGANTVGHHDVFSLTGDAEARLLERSNGFEIGMPGSLGMLRGYLDLPNLRTRDLFHCNFQVLANGIRDVLQRLGLRISLRNATRQTRHPNAETFFRL